MRPSVFVWLGALVAVAIGAASEAERFRPTGNWVRFANADTEYLSWARTERLPTDVDAGAPKASSNGLQANTNSTIIVVIASAQSAGSSYDKSRMWGALPHAMQGQPGGDCWMGREGRTPDICYSYYFRMAPASSVNPRRGGYDMLMQELRPAGGPACGSA